MPGLLQLTLRDSNLIMPEVMLAFFGLGILMTDFLLGPREKKWNALTALLGVGFSGVTLWELRPLAQVHDQRFNDAIVVDPFFIFFGFVFLAATAIVILISVRYLDVEDEHHGEYYALMLFATVGMMFLACGNDLVTLFIALETMAISFYILSGFLRRDRRSNEAAIKYVLLGAFSSGILAYGFSLLYGISGSTNLNAIAESLGQRAPGDLLVVIAILTVSVGVLFKVAAVPFHQWAPDVYEGAPTPISAYVSVASSSASFALLLRLFLGAFWPVRADWAPLITAVAVLSLTLGNLAALRQNNIKRMLAYSSIGHVGYILLGLVAGNKLGLQAMAFYIFVYAFFQTGAFAIVVVLRRKGVIGDEIEDLNGLIHRNPGAAVLMLIFLLSLAGIPPTAGFIGKLLIFWALVETGHYTLAVLAVLYILPAVYYYFRFVAAMFSREATDQRTPIISVGQWVALAAIVLVTVVAGIYPEPFLRLATYSILTPFGL